MSDQGGIPEGAAVAVGDLLDNCARIQPGREVLILAPTDGLHGDTTWSTEGGYLLDRVVHDNGHLTALDDPKVIEVAGKYPGRPGLAPEPRSF